MIRAIRSGSRVMVLRLTRSTLGEISPADPGAGGTATPYPPSVDGDLRYGLKMAPTEHGVLRSQGRYLSSRAPSQALVLRAAHGYHAPDQGGEHGGADRTDHHVAVSRFGDCRQRRSDAFVYRDESPLACLGPDASLHSPADSERDCVSRDTPWARCRALPLGTVRALVGPLHKALGRRATRVDAGSGEKGSPPGRERVRRDLPLPWNIRSTTQRRRETYCRGSAVGTCCGLGPHRAAHPGGPYLFPEPWRG